MARPDELELFLRARAAVNKDCPILVDPGDFDLIPPGESVVRVPGGFFSSAEQQTPNRPLLYEVLFKLIHNGGRRPRRLGIPVEDEDREAAYLPIWNQAVPLRKFVFRPAPSYSPPGSTSLVAHYKWIVDERSVTHFPRFL